MTGELLGAARATTYPLVMQNAAQEAVDAGC